jgi:Arc/MetJ family transcription regulator
VPPIRSSSPASWSGTWLSIGAIAIAFPANHRQSSERFRDANRQGRPNVGRLMRGAPARGVAARLPAVSDSGAPARQVEFRCARVCVDCRTRRVTMATNLAIDPDLLDRALAVSGERTKKAAVTKALQEFIARREQRRVAELLGKLDWDDSYDYKSERSRRAG